MASIAQSPPQTGSQRQGRHLSIEAMVEVELSIARMAQPAWAAVSLRDRLRIIRRVRHILVEDREALCVLLEPEVESRGHEVLVSQIYPLVAACRFLEREAARWLAPRALGSWGRPLWLMGCHATVNREPLGVVLILGPSNYPLLLPGVQALQALVAGNAVLWKPGRGGGAAALRFKRMLVDAGLPETLLRVLPESDDAGRAAARLAVNKVFLTGAASTGGHVLAALAEGPVPANLELSGSDAVIVRADADLSLVVRAIRFGLGFNRSETCIAPRRVFVHHTQSARLAGLLAAECEHLAPVELEAGLNDRLRGWVDQARAAGARVIAGGWDESGLLHGPLVIAGALTEMALLQQSFFAPVLSIVSVQGDEEAVSGVQHCPYALGASIFSRSIPQAQALAARLGVGIVTVNDLIVPTADPRIPFGGRSASGFGVTRGGEGLQEMTVLKVISTRHGNFRPHYDSPTPQNQRLLSLMLVILHGGRVRDRLRAIVQFFGAATGRAGKKSSTNTL